VTIVALIPARAGSKRIPGKNTKLLAGHPLIAYTIAAAQQSGIFAEIVVCTDDVQAIGVAQQSGTSVMHRYPVADDQPDIVWVRDAMRSRTTDAFAILRPTSPFRTAATIQRAWAQFVATFCDSLRAVERWYGPSPYKMWRLAETQIAPLLPVDRTPPWHSMPTQTHPPVYVQNASLEMAWTRVVEETDTISGLNVIPFVTRGYEGFDLNTMADWHRAEELVRDEVVTLPPIPTCA
jgi:CMP-N-acetylneuraminic acid synthetase